MKPIESKRVALNRKIVLRFPDFDGFVSEFAENLSMTGMFVRSDEPQPAGTPVSFELRLEDGAPLVRGSGWVVWSRERSEGPDRAAGMGIEFTELDAKSRRLVRWMILSQLPEGSEPFVVESGTAGGASAPRKAARAGGAVRWLGALVAVLAVAALALWLRPVSEDEPGEPVEEPQGLPPSQAEASASSRAPLAAAESTDTGSEPEDVEDPRALIETTVRNWASAWSDQDVERYLDHYSAAFEPAAGLSLEEWRDQRRQRVAAPQSLRVAITRLETTLVSADRARVSFLQTYRSDGYSDTVDKILELALEEGGWKIRREAAD